MKISDLNYLEVVNTETGKTLAGGGNIEFNITKNVNLTKVVNLNINKNVIVDVNNKDLLATAEADAEAFGLHALAEVDAYTLVDRENELAFAYAESTAAIDLNLDGNAGS